VASGCVHALGYSSQPTHSELEQWVVMRLQG